MDLEDLTVYLIITAVVLYAASKYLQAEPFQDTVDVSNIDEDYMVRLWRDRRNELLTQRDNLVDNYGEAAAEQLITVYRLDETLEDDSEVPEERSEQIEEAKAALQADANLGKISEYNNTYLDNYATPFQGVGCKMTPWGEEICPEEITKLTLNDIDSNIKNLVKEIKDRERIVNISGGTITINTDNSESITSN